VLRSRPRDTHFQVTGLLLGRLRSRSRVRGARPSVRLPSSPHASGRGCGGLPSLAFLDTGPQRPRRGSAPLPAVPWLTRAPQRCRSNMRCTQPRYMHFGALRQSIRLPSRDVNFLTAGKIPSWPCNSPWCPGRPRRAQRARRKPADASGLRRPPSAPRNPQRMCGLRTRHSRPSGAKRGATVLCPISRRPPLPFR
jgi:hypothetical protein